MLALITSCLMAGPALADKPDVGALLKSGAQTLLVTLDARHNDYPTQKYKFRMSVKSKGGTARSMVFRVWQKGDKRLVRFLSPGEVKGMSVLSKGADKMWVYSTETGGKARLVASSARRQALLGSDLGFDDMSQVDLNTSYAATLEKQTATHIWLVLKPKPGADAAWPKLRLGVSKKDVLIDSIEYWDGGKAVKVQKRTDFFMDGNVPSYRRIHVTTVATGHSTTLDMLEQKIGEAIPNRMFTKRSLIRGD